MSGSRASAARRASARRRAAVSDGSSADAIWAASSRCQARRSASIWRPGLPVVVAHRVGDLAQVADPLGRDDDGLRGGGPAGGARQPRLEAHPGLGRDGVHQGVVERGHAVVVELGGDGAEDRHLVGALAEGLAVALDLLAHVLHGVVAAALLELVDHGEVGEVEHVDLLELGGRAVLAGHDVEGHVHEVHDARVALADAGGFDDDQVEAGRLARARMASGSASGTSLADPRVASERM